MEMVLQASNTESQRPQHHHHVVVEHHNQILPSNEEEDPESQDKKNDHVIRDFSGRAQWLRAAVLGANDGLLSTASLMVGVGAVKQDSKTMVLTGTAGLVGGACSMAIGEFVSVYSQYDTEYAQLKRDQQKQKNAEFDEKREKLPNPLQAAGASALAFAVGAVVPLLAAAFLTEYKVRVAVVVAAATVALFGFGWLGAFLGRAPVIRSTVRVVVGGWLAMGITYGLTKAIGSKGL